MIAQAQDVETPIPQPFSPFSLMPYQDDYWYRAHDRNCFKDDESNVQVDWTDIDAEHRATMRALRSSADIQSYTSRAELHPSGLRVISISQGNSWRPLNVTREMFEHIQSNTGASSPLLDLVISFYDRIMASEEAFSGAPTFTSNDRNIEIAYIFKYAFQKFSNDKPESWSIRQTGVYQKYDLTTKHSTWIFMNPTKDCLFQQRLMKALLSPNHCSLLKSHPLLIHNILFATFFPNWRDFLACYEARVLTVSNTTMPERIEDPLRINHQMLTSMRSVESRCLPLQAIFRSFNKTLQTLSKTNQVLREFDNIQHPKWLQMKHLLDNYKSHADAYSQNAAFLQSRAAITSQLVTDTFSFKNSHTSQEQTKYMLDLTLSTVDDSTTVRVITVVTLIYLPSTFMAVSLFLPSPSSGAAKRCIADKVPNVQTLLGMNSFFEMDSVTHKLVVSPQFWIFVVCAVPLTAVTVLYWWVRRKRHPKQVKEKVEFSV
ncbi:uncharacterized protein BDW43DRAFT_317117 [Aspergillus alliaceus]|uniref:uncharacterized protein n=1 Tax=Petromyces alliaceus TaxID=209559 RepID=UPI0012A4BDCB|nr:uncharacterized protein BDW43DRAFT_317117 [Aspergillus alliaceus]KAB8227117.1 hypothetical protein BDW43DRAFT_317117 [Aspergillus alliaceus]